MAAWNNHYACVQQPKFKSKWVPLAGKKRKVPDDPDYMGGYDVEDLEGILVKKLVDINSRPPTKQMAVDDDIAEDIVKDGYIVEDPTAANDGSAHQGDNMAPLEDVEMDQNMEEEDGFDYEGSELSLKGTRVHDDEGHVEHEGDGSNRNDLSSKMKENVQLGSVILSEEVRASLAKKPNDVCPLIPRSIVDQMYKNAMAVVIWQPPPVSFISDRVKAEAPAATPISTIMETVREKKGMIDDGFDGAEGTCDTNLVPANTDDAGDMEVELIHHFPS